MKILKGTVSGGIAYFFLGWIIYGILLNDFMLNNLNQSIARPDGVMIWWAMIMSGFAYALFLTLVLKWSGAKGIADGLKTGALFGLLMGLAIDLSNYSMSTMFSGFTAVIVDVLAWVVLLALTGAVIVLLWGKKPD